MAGGLACSHSTRPQGQTSHGRRQSPGWGLHHPGQAHGGGSHPFRRAGETEAHTATYPRKKLVWDHLASPTQGFSSSFLQGEKDLSGLLHHSEYVCFGSELICIGLLI